MHECSSQMEMVTGLQRKRDDYHGLWRMETCDFLVSIGDKNVSYLDFWEEDKWQHIY